MVWFSSWSGLAVGLVYGPPTVGWFGLAPDLFPVRTVGGSGNTGGKRNHLRTITTLHPAQEWCCRENDSHTQHKGKKYDAGCQCTNTILARSCPNGLLSPQKISHLQPVRKPLTIRGTFRNRSTNQAPQAIWLQSIQAHPTCTTN